MASAAEQLAANVNLAAFGKAKELQQRIWFTLIALLVYRLGTFIPIPGVDPEAFKNAFQSQAGGILGMFNTFSGGAVERMAVFALNVMPYISASIIVQILATTSPSLERLKKEGEAGRKQLNQYTRYLTVALAVLQSYGISIGLQASPGAVLNPGFMFMASTIVTLTGGTMFLMWLGEQITARGVGNGVSLIIFAGIVAELPRTIASMLELARVGELNIFSVLVIGLIMAAAVVFIVFIERSLRRLVVQYPKRQVGNRMFMGESSFLPLKINTAGVIPPIFASSLLLLPTTVMGFIGSGTRPSWMPEGVHEWLQGAMGAVGYGQPLHLALYGLGIIFFCFFYTSIVFNPEETADNLRKYGGFLPGIRPGKKTAEYLDYVLTRLTVIGAAYITAVCLLPEVAISYYNVPFYLGGTSILIVVSVTMDTVTQINSHLVAHQYEGLIKRSKLRGKGR
jgi:preprotein translocase subunit SecY